MKRNILIYLLLHSFLLSWSQSGLDQIRKINLTACLYLHHDKGIYTNNEKIWFSAYLLNTPNPIAEHRVLNVALINEQTKRVQAAQKFMLTDGLSSGFLQLPDTIPPGNYQLVAYTNVLNAQKQPIAQFKSFIKLLNISQQTFNSTLTFLDTVAKNGAIRALVNVSGIDARRKAIITVNYQVGDDFSKSVILDKEQVTITIPEHLLKQRANLLLNVNVDGEVQYHSKTLPYKTIQSLSVKFYPEGGSLIEGLQSRVGWEAKTDDGLPLALKGMLMKNDEPLFEVSTNAIGMGSFNINPNAGENYSLKLFPGVYVPENLTFKLPDASNNDVSIHLSKALVNDSLKFVLSSKQAKRIQIMLHNDLGDYVLLKGETNAPAKVFKVSLSALPKGLTTITILDNYGKPLAERLFFAHYNRKNLLAKLDIEQRDYAKRDSININLKLSNKIGKAASGIVSVAVVQRNRVGVRTANIENYFYLNNHLKELPASLSGDGLLDNDYLEDVLLIKGWRRYTQLELNTLNRDSVYTKDYPIIGGVVLNGRKPVKKVVDLVSFGSIKTGIIGTRADGTFDLSNDDILVERNNNVFLRVGIAKNNYEFKMYDAFDSITNTLAEKIKPAVFESLSNQNKSSIIRNLQNVIALKDVEIKVNRSNFYGTNGEPGTNECGDYVSIQDYLNYPKTPLSERLKPIKNRPYLTRTDFNDSYFKVDRVWYTGCLAENEKMGIAIKGINSGKEYYMAVEDDGGLQYYSTLYWQSGLTTNAAGEIPIRFKAGDIADDFAIIVQGISDNGLVNVKERFKISNKP